MTLLDNRTAFITGIARGQGRAHALRLAAEGADIVGIDAPAQIDSVPFAMGTEGDLDETVRQVESLGRKITVNRIDVRDRNGMERFIEEAGPIDIAVANAGISSIEAAWKVNQQRWQDTIDVNLTGVWNTIQAVLPGMLARGQGGSIIIIASVCGVHPSRGLTPYVASKHGAIGLMKGFALELAPHRIRVNTVNPGNVDTPMINNEAVYERMLRGQNDRGREGAVKMFSQMNAMDTPWVESRDVANAVAWLASDEARFVTGTSITVDAGLLLT